MSDLTRRVRRAAGLATVMRRAATCLLLLSAAGCFLNKRGHVSDYVPKDPELRRELDNGFPGSSGYFFFYPVRGPDPARAFVFFLGNDVAFWAPHQRLAWDLSGEGYSVVGIDIYKYLGKLPITEPAHDSAFSANIGPLIARVRHELGADSLPVVLAGHSFGAELAFWIAYNRPPPKLVGILAMSTRGSGHLRVTPMDWANHEATGPLSFSTIQIAHDLPPQIRIALIRGASDPFIRHDSAFMAVGGARLHRVIVPIANHSLENLLIAGPRIATEMRWMTDTTGKH